jgi:hypothetical protein
LAAALTNSERPARSAERVVVAGRVFDDRREHAAVTRQQRVPGTEVRLPGDLHGVGDVEPLDRFQRVVDDHVRAGVTGGIVEPDPGSPGEHLVRISTWGNGFRPGERFHPRGPVRARRRR